MDSGKWLTHAARLAGTGRGRPPIMGLRRGVSAAYYALFHEVTRLAAEHVLSQGTNSEQAAVRRSYDHGRLKTVCTWVAGQKNPEGNHIRLVVDRAAASPQLVHVAETFVDLQQRRHDADYDHSAAFSKTDVVNSVAQARAACRDLTLSRDGQEFEAFMALATLGTRQFR